MKMIMKSLVTGLAAAFAAFTAQAGDFGPQPVDYQYQVESYVDSRLTERVGSEVWFNSDPYPVYADFGRHGEIAAWAIDITIRARVSRRGGMNDYDYTIIFVDGEPVAFEEDIYGVETA